jgi:hypothetical protein
MEEFDLRGLHPCPFCYGFVIKMGQHKCSFGKKLADLPRFIKKHKLRFGLLLLTKLQHHVDLEDDFMQEVLEKIFAPGMAAVVKNDALILALGWFLFRTRSGEGGNPIQDKLTYLVRLLQHLHQTTDSSAPLAEYLVESNLEILVTAPNQCGQGDSAAGPGNKSCQLLLLMCMQVLRGHAVRHYNLRKNQVLYVYQVNMPDHFL